MHSDSFTLIIMLVHLCGSSTTVKVINDEKRHIKMIEGAYAPIIMQFGGDIGQVVYTYSIIYPKISFSSKQKKPRKDKGLECYNEISGIPIRLVSCDLVGGANYCADFRSGKNRTRTCAVQSIMDKLSLVNLTSPGCIWHENNKYCICSGSRCNNEMMR